MLLHRQTAGRVYYQYVCTFWAGGGDFGGALIYYRKLSTLTGWSDVDQNGQEVENVRKTDLMTFTTLPQGITD